MSNDIKIASSIKRLPTTEFLALEFVAVRLAQYKKLALQTKKLVLEVVLYYFNVFYPFDHEALDISSDILIARATHDEPLMVQCYKRFLEFLPIGMRSRVQGQNLFKQPSVVEQQMMHFYVNDPEDIQEYNQKLDQPDSNGITLRDRMLLMQATLEMELGVSTEKVDNTSLQETQSASP